MAINPLGGVRAASNDVRRFPRLPAIITPWRLQAAGCVVVAMYVSMFLSIYRAGIWPVDSRGVPASTDFTAFWVAGWEALHGKVAQLYDPIEFAKIVFRIFGATDTIWTFAYPPIYLLILAPLGLLPVGFAFIVWDIVTLLGCAVIVYMIVRGRIAVALMLASPFTAWNFFAGQNGFLTASLLGASFLFLERQPMLAGLFIGSLSYKPQFGILFPLALAAARQWRAFASATATAAVLFATSIAAFGSSAWGAFPRGFIAQAGINLFAESTAEWGFLQTIYGLTRDLRGGASLAWGAQFTTAFVIAMIVWRVWRSHARYPLKAATLSAATLLVTPYAFAYDLAAIVIPVAFLASDQLHCGLLKGERVVMLALFGGALALLMIFADRPVGTTFGSVPIGPAIVITILSLVLRRLLVMCDHGQVSS
jgi:arabinofuranan 3-O-arabinosyltransferase